MYLERLSISNMRAIARADIEFRCPSHPDLNDSKPGDNVTLLLGDNGTGKTTILSSIGLAILARVLEGSGYRPYHLVRYGESKAYTMAHLRLDQQDTGADSENPVSVRSHLYLRLRGDYSTLDVRSPPPEDEAGPDASDDDETLWERLYEDRGPGFLLLGYGSTRRVQRSETFDPSSQKRIRSFRYQRIASLFEDHLALVPLSGWLPKEEPPVRDEVVELLDEMLPQKLTFRGNLDEDGQYTYEQSGIPVPFGALSDGYRVYIGLVNDIVYHLNSARPPGQSLFECTGVVLIDEVGLHLHPSWQRLVLLELSRSLPRLQFIVTSHSPIIAGTVRSKNLILLELTEEGAVKAAPSRESLYGRSADEILLSSHFGLQTTRAVGADRHLQTLARKAMDGDSEAALKYMELLAPKEGEPAFEAEPISEAVRPDPGKRKRRELRRRIEWKWYPYGALVAGFAFGVILMLLVWLLL